MLKRKGGRGRENRTATPFYFFLETKPRFNIPHYDHLSMNYLTTSSLEGNRDYLHFVNERAGNSESLCELLLGHRTNLSLRQCPSSSHRKAWGEKSNPKQQSKSLGIGTLYHGNCRVRFCSGNENVLPSYPLDMQTELNEQNREVTPPDRKHRHCSEPALCGYLFALK